MEINYIIRSVREDDLDELFRLSKLNYFLNLPEDREILTSKIQHSIQSFKEEIKEKFERDYIFVLEDLKHKAIVGTSSIIARHGDQKCPHMYFELKEIKKYSETIHTGFIHKVLHLSFDYDGPTELGGLVVGPKFRGHPEKLGRQLSFSRFQFIKMKRRWFKDRLLAELMPPFTDDGESLLWEALGRKFTNLSYEEADVLSRKNKEFVTSLFPKHPIFVTLLPGEVRDSIGKVNPETEPVKHMLQKIGFGWKHHIDPFDGGPHYYADTDKVAPIKATNRLKVHKDVHKGKNGKFGLVGIFGEQGFLCLQSSYELQKSKVSLPKAVLEFLQIEPKDEVFITPMGE